MNKRKIFLFFILLAFFPHNEGVPRGSASVHMQDIFCDSGCVSKERSKEENYFCSIGVAVLLRNVPTSHIRDLCQIRYEGEYLITCIKKALDYAGRYYVDCVYNEEHKHLPTLSLPL